MISIHIKNITVFLSRAAVAEITESRTEKSFGSIKKDMLYVPTKDRQLTYFRDKFHNHLVPWRTNRFNNQSKIMNRASCWYFGGKKWCVET